MICDCSTSFEERKLGSVPCDEQCLNRVLYIECGSKCPCGDFCTNKRFQKGEHCEVESFPAKEKGWGLRALQVIKPHALIMEYVGEVVNEHQFRKRFRQYRKNGLDKHHYFMFLNANDIIDSTMKGNISRFVNHCCQPNAEIQKWTVNGYLRLGFFAKCEIQPFEEITVDYKWEKGEDQEKCYCGAEKCRGFIGSGTKLLPILDGKRKDRDKQKRRGFADLFDEEIELLLSNQDGLRNDDQCLDLCRLMIRVDKFDIRLKMLDVLLKTKSEILKFFLRHHGLTILRLWLYDDNQLDVELQSVQIKALRLLGFLPVANKTVLVQTKILDQVVRLASVDDVAIYSKNCDKTLNVAQDKEFKKVFANIDNFSPLADNTSFDDEIKSTVDWLVEQTILKINDNEEWIVVDDISIATRQTEICMLAQGLLEKWKDLKEYFKIPKLSTESQRQQHQDKIDGKYLDNNDINKQKESSRNSSSRDEFKSAFNRDVSKLHFDRDRNKRRDSWEEPKCVEKEYHGLKRSSTPDYHRRHRSPYRSSAIKRPRTPSPLDNKLRDSSRRRSYRSPSPKRKFRERNSRHYGDIGHNSRAQMSPVMCTLTVLNPAKTKQERRKEFEETVAKKTEEELFYKLQAQDMEREEAIAEEEFMQLCEAGNSPIDAKKSIQGPTTSVTDPSITLSGQSTVMGTVLSNSSQLQPSEFSPPQVVPLLPPAFLAYPPPHLMPPPAFTMAPSLPPDILYSINPSLEDGSVLQKVLPHQPIAPIAFAGYSGTPSLSSDTVQPAAYPAILVHDPNTGKYWWQDQSTYILVYPADDHQVEAMLTKGDFSSIPYFSYDASTGLIHEVQRAAESTPTTLPTPVPPPDLNALKSLSTVNAQVATVLDAPKKRSTEEELESLRKQVEILQQKLLENEAQKESIKCEKELVPEPSDQQQTQKLPPHWKVAYDSEGQRYYYHTQSRQTQWDPPKWVDAKDNKAASTDASASDKSSTHSHVRRPSKRVTVTTAAADTSSEVARRIKEQFKQSISNHIVQILNEYRKPECKKGRITNNEDFKHLARKLTHAIMEKELKACKTVDDLKCNEHVPHKAKEYIKKYLSRFGAEYSRTSMNSP